MHENEDNLKLNKKKGKLSRQLEMSCLDRQLLTDCFSYMVEEEEVQQCSEQTQVVGVSEKLPSLSHLK